jgi:hypothetical protein
MQQNACVTDLLNHLIGECEQLRRDCKPERLRCLELDHESKLGRLHHWQITELFCAYVVKVSEAMYFSRGPE